MPYPEQAHIHILYSRLRLRIFWATQLLILLLVMMPYQANSHGGEEHGTQQNGQSTETGLISVSAQSDNFELVLKFRAIDPGKMGTLEAYLSDFETNSPIANASIEVSLNGHDSITVKVEAEKDPGLYNINLIFPDSGTYDLLFDITAGEKADILVVHGIKVEFQQVFDEKSRKAFPLLPIVIAVTIILAISATLVLRKRGSAKKITSTIGILILLLGCLNSSAYSHGGEDHGDQGNVGASGTPGYMPKGSQFLLGVQTVKAAKQTVSKQIHALGRVVAPPKSQVQVYAPQSGLLVSAKDAAYPNQGDWVNKGQPIAALQVIDQFVIRAPISGIVTAVHSVPGEQVDPSHELFTIYDYTKIWIEANLFEDDLVHMDPKPSASISLDIYPGETFPIKFVNFDNAIDPNTRTLKAIYDISNPKMLLRPGMVVDVNIETEKRLDAMVIPNASIMDWEGMKVVFVHIQPEIFEMRPIRIVGYYGDLVAVEGRIQEGDRVVTSGAYELLNIPIRLIEGGYR